MKLSFVLLLLLLLAICYSVPTGGRRLKNLLHRQEKSKFKNSDASKILKRFLGRELKRQNKLKKAKDNGEIEVNAAALSDSEACSRTYTVVSGDYCWLIATNNKLSMDQFYQLNPGINCNNLQIGAVVCVAGGSPGPSPPTPPTPSGEVSYDQFVRAVTSNGYPTPSSAQYNSFIKNYKSAGGITSRRELAMFLAEILWESGGLIYKRELACQTTQCPGSYRSPGDAPNLFYFGRGYIQLSWSYNYRAASRALFNDDRLVYSPDSVASDENIAWQTAFWFWKANVHGDAGVQAGQFGSATNKINGDLECGARRSTGVAAKRFEVYKKVLTAFDVRETPNPAGC